GKELSPEPPQCPVTRLVSMRSWGFLALPLQSPPESPPTRWVHVPRGTYRSNPSPDPLKAFSGPRDLHAGQGASLRGGPLDWQRSAHGLPRRRPAHASGGSHGAAGSARYYPAHCGNAAPGRGLSRGQLAWPDTDQGTPQSSRGV